MSTVTCSTCGTESAAGTKFCSVCGSSLPRTCPVCGHQVSATQQFCDNCGTNLAATAAPAAAGGASAPPDASVHGPASPADQERRLVTILFADLVGSTSLGESLDPEAVYELVERVQGRIEEQVVRYGGQVAKRLGDGLMALFGAPIAREDDAERAILAGLAMQRAMTELDAGSTDPGSAVQLRVGITSGEVVAGAMAGVYDVIGDAANVAARLQGAAAIGGVLVGEETMRLARRRIQFGEEQELNLKGKAEPVGAYAALGVREHLGERWEGMGHQTPLVGRAPELSAIQAAWESVQRGEGQLLTLVGEPGVGKSRLLAEAVERITAGGEEAGAVRILPGRCLSYGQSVSLWLLADLLRSLCGVREVDGREVVGGRIVSTVEEILSGADETDRAIASDVLGEVLGLPAGASLVANAGPQIRRQSLVRILGMILGSLSERAPLLLVLEDLHWLDSASQEILAELLLDVQGIRVLVLAATRPGWEAPWHAWSWTERLVLHPLPEGEAARLAGAVLGGMPLAPALADYLQERAGGNPFFVEELLRFLEERGGLTLQGGRMGLVPGIAEMLPSTLTEVLLARLDRLESQVKGVAQVASVIGRSFAVRLLARVMEREERALDGPLRSLQQAEIAFSRRRGDPEYVFKHVTVRDVAYSMLVRRRQRQLHLQTARAIAALYPTDEYVEMIAHHYARTEEDAEAAEWLEKAGDRAGDTYANEAAIGHYRGALERFERCGADEVTRAGIDEKLGETLFRMSRYEEAQAALEQAVERYQQAGHMEDMGRATAQLGRVLQGRGELEEARRRLEEMATLLEPHGPSTASVRVEVYLANGFQLLGLYQEMLRAAERALELARAVGDEGLRGEAQERRGTALGILGRLEESRGALEEAISLSEGAGDLDGVAAAVSNLGVNRAAAGKLAEAVRSYERVLELAVRMGFVQREMFGHLNFAALLMMTGEWKQARQHLARAEEIASVRGVAA